MRDLTVLDLLERAADRLPKKTAVIDIAGSYNYSKLREDARSLGAYLARHTAGRVPLAIYMEKSYLHLVAMYAVLYSGNFYVPLDHKTPIERLCSILDTIESRTLIVDEKSKKSLEKMGYEGELIIVEEVLDTNLDSFTVSKNTIISEKNIVSDNSAVTENINASKNISTSECFIAPEIADTDLMYLIFTSGSTGVPKGVAISHRAVMDYIDAFISQIGLCEDDVCGNQAPFYTDFSLRDVYGSVAACATLCIIPQSYFISPKRLLTFIDGCDVTFLSWVPTAYRLVSQFDGLSKLRPRSIKKILFSGESMPVPVYSYWKSFYPDAEYIQCYGPTEATGACCFYRAGKDYDDADTIPIGRPFKNTGIILLDEDDNIISDSEVGKKGEICVYGTCLADGYYNNPEKTREVFVQNPLMRGIDSRMYRTGDIASYDAEGNLVFSSRKDYQVKHGGKRIELGEIETAVMTVPGIKAACCVHRRSDDVLVLYYTGEQDKAGIQEAVSDRLPKYMIPGEYIRQEELPMLESGKLDRKLMDIMANT